jgi:hypothetical protein
LCWRCITGCRIEIPNQAMPPIWEAEWRGIEASFEHNTRSEHIWDDLVDQDLEDEKPEAYRAAEFDHLMTRNKEAACLLTIHPEMGLDHQHVQVAPNSRGTGGHVYMGYFMCLTPENDQGVEEDDMEEHVIEALRVTWSPGKKPRAKALVRNPQKRPAPKHSMTDVTYTGPPRGERLFDVRSSQGRPTQGTGRYNIPHLPLPVHPHRKVNKVRHSGQGEQSSHCRPGAHAQPPACN